MPRKVKATRRGSVCVCGGGTSASLEATPAEGMHPHTQEKAPPPCSTLEITPRRGHGLETGRE